MWRMWGLNDASMWIVRVTREVQIQRCQLRKMLRKQQAYDKFRLFENVQQRFDGCIICVIRHRNDDEDLYLLKKKKDKREKSGTSYWA